MDNNKKSFLALTCSFTLSHCCFALVSACLQTALDPDLGHLMFFPIILVFVSLCAIDLANLCAWCVAAHGAG
ncbi:hypothetical protein BC834DRAFT_872582 [Gloeopeniophorella convolvens]|nr:hypothetical protein BC834DRAFT_872582 [Gloeopeniophorella convolvens]